MILLFQNIHVMGRNIGDLIIKSEECLTVCKLCVIEKKIQIGWGYLVLIIKDTAISNRYSGVLFLLIIYIPLNAKMY